MRGERLLEIGVSTKEKKKWRKKLNPGQITGAPDQVSPFPYWPIKFVNYLRQLELSFLPFQIIIVVTHIGPMQTFPRLCVSPHRLLSFDLTRLKENIQAEGPVWVKAQGCSSGSGVADLVINNWTWEWGEGRGKGMDLSHFGTDCCCH